MPKRVVVIQESYSGRNQQFKDNLKSKTMSRSEFVKEIEKGNYQNYHVRVINGVKTPVSNPDNSTNNNLD
ncbi:MAG: hypothetical protein GYA14_07070 [Ignavibacteria bacterium]|nr:hypothetical protein [Ignavibacteria bacterium]